MENNPLMAASTLEAPPKPQAWRDDVDQDQVDTNVDIVTPENIAFNYRVAGPFRRLPAYLIDFGLRAIVMLLIAFAFWMILMLTVSISRGTVTIIGPVLVAVYVVIFFVQYWFYGGLFETYWNGQTPGKWLLGLRVLTVEGQPVNLLQAVMRNVLRVADFMPPLMWNIFRPLSTLEPFASFDPDTAFPAAPVLLLYIIPVMAFSTALLVMMMNNKFQRLGDLLCGTMVVIEERSWLMGIARLEDPRAAQLAAYLPPNYVVSRSLAKTLATYVERRQYFSLNRRREIARHLAEPLLIRFGLPADTSHDLLLCALYYRTFVADRGNEEVVASPSPFLQPGGQMIVQANLNPLPPTLGEIRIRT